MEQFHYRHRQLPVWFIIMVLSFWLLSLMLICAKSRVALVLLLPSVIFTTVFWGLTIEVNSKEIRLCFGLGLIKRTICRKKIDQVTQVRNRWWYGWGIRLTPHGWMWSMGELDAIELTYSNSKKFRIGTNQPQFLLKALTNS